jgi:hypothetical protein
MSLLASGLAGVVVLFERRWRCALHTLVLADARTTVFCATTPNDLDHYLHGWLSQDTRPTVLGFDVEWRSGRGDRGAQTNQVALLQLAVESQVLIVQLQMTGVTPALKHLLFDDKVLKCGVGAVQDAVKLWMDYGLCTRGLIELNDLHNHMEDRQAPETKHHFSLAGLFNRYLKCSLQKELEVVRSNWEAHPLSTEQIEYAARDALAGLQIFNCIAGIEDLEAVCPVLTNQAALAFGRHTKSAVKKAFDARNASNNSNNNSNSDGVRGESNSATSGTDSSKTKAAAGRNCRAEEKARRREMKKAWVSRKSPLYENCRLLAPDGENTAANDGCLLLSHLFFFPFRNDALHDRPQQARMVPQEGSCRAPVQRSSCPDNQRRSSS